VIPVTPQPEPPHFDARVRQPGQAFLRRASTPINWEKHKHQHFWTRLIEDIYNAYGGICAYSAHWIPRDGGGSTVDHFLPKSNPANYAQAYEWDNYRLAARPYNSNKGTNTIVDPFVVKPEWFILDLPSLLIKIGSGIMLSDRVTAGLICHTIGVLKLNEYISVKAREDWVKCFLDGIPFRHLEQRAPFIAYELKRQGYDEVAKLQPLFLRPKIRGP